MKEFIVYTAARFGLFAVTYGVVLGAYALVDDGGPLPVLWPLVIAALLSSVISVYLLRELRQRFAEQVTQRAGRVSERYEAMKAKEDVD